MIREYEIEPVRGLPGDLPADESIVWQGAPDWRSLMVSVFHARLVAAWFAGIAALALVAGGTGWRGAALTMLVSLLGLALLAGLAWAQARTTVYTLTQKRLVLRFGVALPKCVNLPLQLIESADLRPAGKDWVEIALRIHGRFPLAWMQMWPHVRPWRAANPQPMLRGVPASLAPLLAAMLAAADPARHRPVAAVAAPSRGVAAEAPALGVAA